MGKMVLEIPEDLSEALRIPLQEQSSRLCRELAVADASVFIALSRLGQLSLLPQRFPEGIEQLDILQTQGKFRLSQAVYDEALRVVGEGEVGDG